MTLIDRSAPGIRVTVLPNEKALSGTPLNLDGRVLSFSFEDCETKSDKVSITLDNFDLSLFDRDELVGGAVLEVTWGYPGNMAPPRRVVIKTLKGFTTLTIEGLATSALMNQHAKTRAWEGKTRAAVAREIAAEYGYEGTFLTVEETEEPLDMISQSGETDARFLRRLAAREHFEFFVDDTGFHWHARNQATAPTHVLTWFSDPGRGDILSISVESDLVKRVGSVAVKGRDPVNKKNIEEKATGDTVERSTISPVTHTYDARTNQIIPVIDMRNSTTSVQTSSAPTNNSAKRESDARFRRAERQTVKLSMQIIGDPTLRAKAVVEVRGISTFLSGKYYVKECKHSLSSSGYLCDLKLTRDGTGGRAKGTAATQGKPQGGQANKNTPRTEGTLTHTNVFDPRTNTVRTEYKRDGRPLGMEDPEAGVSKSVDETSSSSSSSSANNS